MTEQDMELTKLAAKAAGIEGVNFDRARRDWSWNPLDDDGDALRLAVKLHMNFYGSCKYSTTAEIISDSDEPSITKKEYCDEKTKNAATRRAIVRAAAEIGKQMELNT